MSSVGRHAERFRPWLGLWLIVGPAAWMLSCDSSPPEGPPESGGTLRVGVLERLDYPTPIRPPGRATLEFLNHVTPPLGWVNPQGRVETRAASHWSEMENIWDFYLTDLVWEDGRPLRPQDFRATWRASLHPLLRAEWGGRFDFIQNVRAYTDTTLRITWHLLPPNRYRAAMFLPLPSHVIGDDPDVTSYHDWPITSRPLSCGPFMMTASSVQTFDLVRSSTWTRQPAYLDAVQVMWVPEPDAVQAFQRGELDVIDDVSAQGLERLRDVQDMRTFAVVGRSYLFLGWNLRDGRASELAVRRAAAMAVDVQGLIDDFTLGQGEPSRGPLMPIQGFADTTATIDFDPEGARRLLRDAGWGDSNANGILDKRGVNLHFEILVAEEKLLHRQIATAVAAQLREVGFGIQVRPVPTLQFLDFLEGREFECFIGQWYPDLDANIEATWSSNVLGRFNYGGYDNGRADSLMTVLRYELMGERRDFVMHVLQRTIYEDQPYLFLLQPPRFTVVAKRVRGADPNILSTFWNLPEWWIPQAMQ